MAMTAARKRQIERNRAKLPPSAFAIPDRRVYPLDNRKAVHASIAHFSTNQGSYTRPVRAEAARRIKSAAKKLGIQVRAF